MGEGNAIRNPLLSGEGGRRGDPGEAEEGEILERQRDV